MEKGNVAWAISGEYGGCGKAVTFSVLKIASHMYVIEHYHEADEPA